MGQKTTQGTPAHAVEQLVRAKNQMYRKWRKGKRWTELDQWCTECLFRFGTLPHWVEFAQARRSRDWNRAAALEKEQAAWRSQIREWCLTRGVTTYPNQSAQFYKYFSAWYRYKQEKEHGKVERQFARQMY